MGALRGALADEMGLFENDMERLGMLELQALRAVRLVIDTGIHAQHWTREQAIAVLESAWADNRDDAETEIDRYITMPGQATCYMLGQLEILRWRRAAEERSGASFSLATFHDALLDLGPFPTAGDGTRGRCDPAGMPEERSRVIGVPSSAGAFANGQEQAPRALRAAGLIARLRDAGADVDDMGDSPIWRWRPDRARPRAQNVDAVIDQVRSTRPRVAARRRPAGSPVVVGGDCTVGIGTIAGAIDVYDSVGVIYFDLHADMNTPASVNDGALDWTGVAHMLALEGTKPDLVRVGPRLPILAAEQLVLFGHGMAHATPWEREQIERLDIAGVAVEEVRRRCRRRGASGARHRADPVRRAISCISTSTSSTSLMRHCPRTRGGTPVCRSAPPSQLCAASLPTRRWWRSPWPK